jgi:HEAT repeat protein
MTGCQKFSAECSDLVSIFFALFRSGPWLAAVSVLLVLPVFTSAQTNFEDLRNKLSVGSVEEKRNALFEIRNLHTEQASLLAVPALSDQSEIVRATAVSSVIFLPSDEAVRLLLPLLDDTDPFVRRETAFALGELGNAQAVGVLVQDLRKEKEVENRSAAAMALGKIGRGEAVEPLLALLKKKPSESEEFVRATAARSIGEIAQLIRFGKRQKTTPQNFLPEKYKEHLQDNNSPGLILPPSFNNATTVLGKVLENRREADDTRRSAAFALGSIGSSDTIQLLQTHLNSKDPYLAEICKEALLRFPHAN